MTDPEAPIRLLVVDDHPILREGVAAIVENTDDIIVVGEASDGQEAITRFLELRPDVTLIDMQMPGMSGIEAMSAIRREAPDARFIVLTTYAGDVPASRALRAGANAYLLKSGLLDELLPVIRKVHAGERHIDADVADGITRHDDVKPLSDREISVLNLVGKGKPNRQIAIDLEITEETVKAHLKSIFQKLGVADRTLAVAVALRRGAMEP